VKDNEKAKKLAIELERKEEVSITSPETIVINMDILHITPLTTFLQAGRWFLPTFNLNFYLTHFLHTQLTSHCPLMH
jgi:hypothetical protein